MKKILLTLFIVFFITSCIENEITYVKTALNNRHLHETPSIDTSDTDSYSIIYLETSDSSRLGNISKILMNDEVISVVDRDNLTITTFNSSGGFISKINKKGKGPNEYASIGDVKLHNNKLYIFDYSSRKILQFDYTGNVINVSILGEYQGMAFATVNDEKFAFFHHSPNTKTNNAEVVITDLTGNITATYHQREESEFKGISNSDYFSQNKHGNYFIPLFTDKVCFIDNKGNISEKHTLGLVDLIAYDKQGFYEYIYDIKVCDNEVAFIDTALDGEPISLLVDLKNKQARLITDISIRGCYKDYFLVPLSQWSDSPLPSSEQWKIFNDEINTPIALINSKKIIWR